MDALSIKRCIFAGTSWGGQIGARLAVQAPERLAALVMLNTPLAPSLGGHTFELIMTRLMVNSSVYANGVIRAMFSLGHVTIILT
jgi:pimeloyl-ACP methyl ester carboxylesterase